MFMGDFLNINYIYDTFSVDFGEQATLFRVSKPAIRLRPSEDGLIFSSNSYNILYFFFYFYYFLFPLHYSTYAKVVIQPIVVYLGVLVYP